MLLFYLRHGDPIYIPDSLTPLGKRQAEALSKRLSLYGIDKIYASTSERAIQTATPTAEILKKEITTLDFANEIHAWQEITCTDSEGNRRWLFDSGEAMEIFSSEEVRALGHRWCEHPYFAAMNLSEGFQRIKRETDAFLASLGYESTKDFGKYKIVNSNPDRVALFAHAGFGIAFLSTLLGIPYPEFASHFDMCHTGMTVINFREIGDYAYPRIMTYSSDSHLYREGLPTRYNNTIPF